MQLRFGDKGVVNNKLVGNIPVSEKRVVDIKSINDGIFSVQFHNTNFALKMPKWVTKMPKWVTKMPKWATKTLQLTKCCKILVAKQWCVKCPNNYLAFSQQYKMLVLKLY